MGILRLLLALSIVIVHSNGILGHRVAGAGAGIQAFYLISGFYMALVLNSKYKSLSWTTFISQRLLRLYPLYALILLATVAWGLLPWIWKGLPPNGPLLTWYNDGSHLSGGALIYLIASQLSLIGQDLALFLKFSGSPWGLELTLNGINQAVPVWSFMLVPQAWSISIELLFYMVAPFLVRMSVRSQLLFVGASLLAREVLYLKLGLIFDPWTHRLILLELGTFVAGSLAYRFYARYKAKLAEFSYLAIPAIALIGFAIVSFLSLGMSPLQGVGFIGLIGASLPVLFARFRETSWDLKLGELSYPVYIVHMLVVTVAGPPLEHRVSPPIMVASIVVLSLAAAVILNVGFVIPLERFRHRLLKSDRAKPALRFRFFRRRANLGYANTKP